MLKEVPVTLSKDSRCWILRIGNETTYPASLTSVFFSLAREEMDLNGITTHEEVIGMLEDVRDSIIERVANLEEKVEAWDRTKYHKETLL